MLEKEEVKGGGGRYQFILAYLLFFFFVRFSSNDVVKEIWEVGYKLTTTSNVQELNFSLCKSLDAAQTGLLRGPPPQKKKRKKSPFRVATGVCYGLHFINITLNKMQINK